jgi:hypothetical protein
LETFGFLLNDAQSGQYAAESGAHAYRFDVYNVESQPMEGEKKEDKKKKKKKRWDK